MHGLASPEAVARRDEAWASQTAPVLTRLASRPRIPLSAWADEHGYLSDGTRWNTSVVPYMREILDTFTDRRVRRVVVMKPSRVGYTEGIGQYFQYVVRHDPERVLVIHPTEGDAKDWSRKQLEPAMDKLRETEGERVRINGTLLDKMFDGGSITIRGAHSPKGLRRHTARDVVFDEVDGFEAFSGKEGDGVKLGERANRTIPDRNTVMGSTPALKHSSRIYAALKLTTWERYHVPCPHCKELQVLEWGGPDAKHGVKWGQTTFCRGCGSERSPDDEECPDCHSREVEVQHDWSSAHYVCIHCGEAIEESHKDWMLSEENGARWIPQFPGRPDRGFQITGEMSPFEGASWAMMAKEFLETKDDPAQFQVWVNQWKGEPYEDRGVNVDPDSLEKRAEIYTHPGTGEQVLVPDGVGLLCGAVDVQLDRLELLVRGYGMRWETWDILHERIYGSPRNPETWARLDSLLAGTYGAASGSRLRISATMIDVADGNTSEYAYAFVKPREARNIWACRGDSTGRPDHPPLKSPTKANSEGVRVWTIGKYAAKASVIGRLRVQRPGKNYIHLRKAGSPPICNGFDAEYFAQLGAHEIKRVRKKGSLRYENRIVQVREQDHGSDLMHMADSAFRALGSAAVARMPELVEAVREGRDLGGSRKRGRRVRSEGVS